MNDLLMKKKVIKIILLKTFAIFFLLSCESRINFQDLSGVSDNVRQYTETYHDAVKRFEEWQAGEEIFGFPIYTETFDKTGALVETKADSDYSSGPVTTKYNSGNDEVMRFSRYDHEGLEIERGKYLRKTSRDLEYEVINEEGEIIRRTESVIENKRIIKRIDNDYVNELFLKHEYHYEDGLLSTTLNWSSTIEGVFDDEPTRLNYKHLEFDQFGNWTMRLVYKLDSDEPEFIMIREFEYFQ